MAFPRAFQQDTYDCSGFYVEHKMEPVDCQVAFSSLPHGSQPILFKNHPDEGDPYSLPYEVRYESCRMRLQVAGPAAERLDIVPFVPNEIRYLASDVIDKCVMGSVVPGIEPGTQGGFASKGLSNAIDYLINPDSNIAGPSEWPQNTSFFTLMIWDERSPDWSFNPGNADPLLGYEILDELAFAIDDAEEGSLAEQELRSRYDFFDRAVSHMRRSVENNVWWQDWPAQPSLSLTDATSACNGKSPGLAYSNCSRLL